MENYYKEIITKNTHKNYVKKLQQQWQRLKNEEEKILFSFISFVTIFISFLSSYYVC
jgi:hypothetical protein